MHVKERGRWTSEHRILCNNHHGVRKLHNLGDGHECRFDHYAVPVVEQKEHAQSSGLKGYTVATLYDTHNTDKEPTIDLDSYQDDEVIKVTRRRGAVSSLRSRLMFKREREIDPRLSNLRPEQKKNDPMHIDSRLQEQLCHSLHKSIAGTKTLLQINQAYASQRCHYRTKTLKSDDGDQVFERPSIGQSWKVKEFYKNSPTVLGKKVYEVLI